jgi:hypothetical protein
MTKTKVKKTPSHNFYWPPKWLLGKVFFACPIHLKNGPNGLLNECQSSEHVLITARTTQTLATGEVVLAGHQWWLWRRSSNVGFEVLCGRNSQYDASMEGTHGNESMSFVRLEDETRFSPKDHQSDEVWTPQQHLQERESSLWASCEAFARFPTSK